MAKRPKSLMRVKKIAHQGSVGIINQRKNRG
jgi:hypothetical protein